MNAYFNENSGVVWLEAYGERFLLHGSYGKEKGEHVVQLILSSVASDCGRAYAEGRKDEAEESGASGLGGGVRSSPLSGSIPESSTTSLWLPIETAPEDTNVLVATQGGYVDAAFWTDEDGEGRKWWWLVSANTYAQHPIHPKLVPTHWMPLPKHPGAAS